MVKWKHSDKSNDRIYSVMEQDNSVILDSRGSASSTDIGAVKQTAYPESIRDKRIRFKAEISTQDAEGAGLWLTASSKNWHITDGMYDRLVKGNMDWQHFELVIHAPSETTYLSYGLWMKGNGICKMRNPVFETVEDSVSLTTSKIWDCVGNDRWEERF